MAGPISFFLLLSYSKQWDISSVSSSISSSPWALFDVLQVLWLPYLFEEAGGNMCFVQLWSWQDNGLWGCCCNCCILALLPSPQALLTVLLAMLFYMKELMLNVYVRFVSERHENSRIWLSDYLEVEGQESRGINWQVIGRQHNVINSIFIWSHDRIVYIRCDKYIKILLQYSFPVPVIVAS